MISRYFTVHFAAIEYHPETEVGPATLSYRLYTNVKRGATENIVVNKVLVIDDDEPADLEGKLMIKWSLRSLSPYNSVVRYSAGFV